MSDPDAVQEADAWGQSLRPKRLSGAELRARVLDTAEALLGENGLTVSLDHLNVEELIRRVGVPRTSTFNEFGGKEGLITALILKMIRPHDSEGAAFSQATVDVARSVVFENQHRLVDEHGHPDQRGQDAVLREAVRRGARQNFDDITSKPSWKTYMALSVSLPALPPGRGQQVLETLQIVEDRFIDTMSSFYEEMLATLGRRVREGMTLQQIAAAGSAVVEGIAQRQFVNPQLVDTPIMLPGLDGEIVEWHLSALGFLAIIEGMTEPVT